MHRKQQDEQYGEPEIRHCDAQLGQAHQANITQTVVPCCGINSNHQCQHRSQGHGQQGQGHGQGQAFDNQFEHRTAVGIAQAKVAHQHAAYPSCIALHRGLVQAEFDGQGLYCFWRRVWAHEHLGCITWQHFKH